MSTRCSAMRGKRALWKSGKGMRPRASARPPSPVRVRDRGEGKIDQSHSRMTYVPAIRSWRVCFCGCQIICR
jgi:hypothetical protein